MKTAAIAAPQCLRSVECYLDEGHVRIGIMDNDTLEGLHGCNRRGGPMPTTPMKFFRPSWDLSVLSCTTCNFRLEIWGLPDKGFEKDFLELERWLKRYIDALERISCQPSDKAKSVDFPIGTVTVEEFPQVWLDSVRQLKIWHCAKDFFGFKKTYRTRMNVVYRGEKELSLHCPHCGFQVALKLDFSAFHSSFGQIIWQLKKSARQMNPEKEP